MFIKTSNVQGQRASSDKKGLPPENRGLTTTAAPHDALDAQGPAAKLLCMNAPVDVSFFARAAKPLTSYRPYWAQRFGVGIIAQPDWQSAEPFKVLGKPNLFWGVTAGNMDSMINRYTADRKIRSDDAYTPGDIGGKRPDRAAIVYSQRCREAYKDVPIILGGIEGSLRRIAHYDYWSDKV